MRLRRIILLVTCAAASVRAASEPTIAFSGVLAVDGRTRLALTDLSTQATKWVEAGDTFMGYLIVRYEPKDESVYVRKGGEEARLGISAPKAAANSPVANTSATSSGAVGATSTPAQPGSSALPPPPPVEASPAPPATVSPPPDSGPPAYTIQSGDTVESIALSQGVTTQQIRDLNPALNSTSLRTGETIRIR